MWKNIWFCTRNSKNKILSRTPLTSELSKNGAFWLFIQNSAMFGPVLPDCLHRDSYVMIQFKFQSQILNEFMLRIWCSYMVWSAYEFTRIKTYSLKREYRKYNFNLPRHNKYNLALVPCDSVPNLSFSISIFICLLPVSTCLLRSNLWKTSYPRRNWPCHSNSPSQNSAMCRSWCHFLIWWTVWSWSHFPS